MNSALYVCLSEYLSVTPVYQDWLITSFLIFLHEVRFQQTFKSDKVDFFGGEGIIVMPGIGEISLDFSKFYQMTGIKVKVTILYF